MCLYRIFIKILVILVNVRLEREEIHMIKIVYSGYSALLELIGNNLGRQDHFHISEKWKISSPHASSDIIILL